MSSAPSANIESVLQEQRVFSPTAEQAAQALVGSLEAYQQLADQAKNDPERFWGEAARKELHWFEPFHT
ncbi:MAG: acetyl-coenzyme A synthetase N-terminal domain-containing protein, partial [Prochlorococcus sp.]